jgi:hypothetical protein
MALLLTALAVGCQGNRAPVLGVDNTVVQVAQGPQVTLTVPATAIPGPTLGVPTNTIVTAAFTQAMNPATITAAGTFTVTGPGRASVAGAVTYASGTAIFTPAAALAADTTYTAIITDAAANVAGATLEGDQAPLPESSDYAWSFTTGAGPDLTRPQVTLTVPATTVPGPTTGVAVGAAVSAIFTEPMNPGTITPASFTLTGPGSVSVPGSVAYLSSTATFTPAAALAAGTTYIATLAAVITDVDGNALAGNQGSLPAASAYVWSFTTSLASDSNRPQVALTIPATTLPGPTPGVATDAAIAAVFTKAMNPGTITVASFTVTTPPPGLSPMGNVTYAGNSRTAVFTPLAELAADTTYTVKIAATVTDLSGNQLAGNQAALPAASSYAWTFTTGSAAAGAPSITLTAPADLAVGVAPNAAVNATFSAAMDPLTLSTATFKVQASGNPLGSPISGTVTYDPAAGLATFTPLAPFAANTSYTATVTGATGLAGDALAAGLAPNPWTFTTGAALAPGAVNLGAAGPFGIMATAAITSTGLSVINGNVALAPGTSMTGFPPGVVNGTIDLNDSVAAKAQTDLLTAYDSAKTLPPGTTIAGGADLGAMYPDGMPPGTYTSGSTMLVSTRLVLDAGGDANAVWVFQIGSSLTTGASIALANGAKSSNVFWVPTLDATVGVGTTFYGTIISGRNVTAVTGAIIYGRILAGATTGGTIALQDNTVNVPAS